MSEAGAYTDHSSVISSTHSNWSDDDDGGGGHEESHAPVRLSPLIIPSACPYHLRAIIEQCWADKPAHRPSAAQILALLPRSIDEDGENEGLRLAAAAAAATASATASGLEALYAMDQIAAVFEADTPLTAVRFAHANASVIAFAAMDGTVTLATLDGGGEVMHVLEGHTHPVTDFDWSVSDDWVLTVSTDKTLRIWDVRQGVCVRIVYAKSEAFTARFHPRNSNVFVVGFQNKKVRAFNVSTGKAVAKASTSASVTALTFSHSGETCYAGDTDGHIYVYQVGTGKAFTMRQVQKLSAANGRGITSLAYKLRAGRRGQEQLVLANCKDNSLKLFLAREGGGSNGSLSLVRSFFNHHSSLALRSVFCPRVRSRTGPLAGFRCCVAVVLEEKTTIIGENGGQGVSLVRGVAFHGWILLLLAMQPIRCLPTFHDTTRTRVGNHCFVSGSEDGSVILYDVDVASTAARPCSADGIGLGGARGDPPVVDVSWSADETFLASVR